MFHKRKNSQKPGDDFIKKFRRTFAGVVPTIGDHNDSTSFPAGSTTERSDTKLNDAAPLSMHDLRLTQFVDPSAFFPFSNRSSNLPGMWNIFHSQAGDLHTPTMKLDPTTPLSLATAIAGAPADTQNTPMFLDHLNQQYFWESAQDTGAYGQEMYSLGPLFQPDSGSNTLNTSVERSSSLNEVDIQGNVSSEALTEFADQHSEGEKFRFNATLHAQTAMIKYKQEIPVTYLNKGQSYLLSVVDLNPPQTTQLVTYRTYFRVSFNEEEQRSKPAACWQLWKEARGLNEARQREGKPLAVEYVGPSQGENEDQKHNLVQREHASFDGFSVIWTAYPLSGKSECAVIVRFNFLSTDFNLAKGVKGSTVRLCAKTEVIPIDNAQSNPDYDVEVCYCKVKLFRDHGAERKLHNDAAHVKKTIEKLSQEITHGDTEGGNSGDRKHSTSLMGPSSVKKSRLRPRWSMDSQNGLPKVPPEDDLHSNLVIMQEMLTSNRSVSVLNLRGGDQDDPDLFPIQLPSDQDEPEDHKHSWSQRNVDESAVVSTRMDSSTSVSPCFYLDELENLRDQFSKCPMKVRQLSLGRSQAGFIDAIGIDPTYRPPTERTTPVACFFVRFAGDETPQHDCYRAIYITERTVIDLTKKISEKQQIDPKYVARLLQVKQHGPEVMTDHDVRELPEGQDIVARFTHDRDYTETIDIILAY